MIEIFCWHAVIDLSKPGNKADPKAFRGMSIDHIDAVLEPVKPTFRGDLKRFFAAQRGGE